MRAVTVAVDGVLNGRKAKSEYFEKPMSQLVEDNQFYDASNLPEEEKEKLREQLVKNLKAMQKSHETFVAATHKKG